MYYCESCGNRSKKDAPCDVCGGKVSSDSSAFFEYEYLSVDVMTYRLDEMTSLYSNFGWEKSAIVDFDSDGYYVAIKLRRKRNSSAKDELTKLQVRAESKLSGIGRGYKMIGVLAMSVAMLVGLVGITLLAAAGLLWTTQSQLAHIFGVVCIVCGLAVCVQSYVFFKAILKKGERRMTDKLAKVEAEIKNICQAAHAICHEEF